MSNFPPFIAIGNDELEDSLIVKKGDILQHRHENGQWEDVVLEYGKEKNAKGEMVESPLLGFYKSKNGKLYLASISGKLLNRDTLRIGPKPVEIIL